MHEEAIKIIETEIKGHESFMANCSDPEFEEFKARVKALSESRKLLLETDIDILKKEFLKYEFRLVPNSQTLEEQMVLIEERNYLWDKISLLEESK